MKTGVLCGEPVVLLDWEDISEEIREWMDTEFEGGCFNCKDGHIAYVIVEKNGNMYPACIDCGNL